MDTSEQYINMCRRAKELQEMWEPEPGDFYKLPGHFITCIVLKNSLIDMDAIWLPRIDQLISNWTNPYDAIESMLHGWPVEYDETESLEINGIKRVMKLKYNKSWNGKDWIE